MVIAFSSGAVWKEGGRAACACGMTVGCCCERSPGAGGAGHALKPGASCALRKGGRRCSLRRSDGPALRTRVDPPSARGDAWLSSVSPIRPDRVGSPLLPLEATPSSAPAREPLSPPPERA